MGEFYFVRKKKEERRQERRKERMEEGSDEHMYTLWLTG
jgi:hypothetical protein